MSSPYIAGLILARGGSKAIPRKNVLNVGGKPLIAWTIEAAMNSGYLDRIIVSTDDDEIAEVAREWGAETPFIRPAELAQDDSPPVPAMVHAIDWIESHGDDTVDYAMLLQPTSPLRTAEDIDGAVELSVEKRAESVVSVCPTHAHPYWTKCIGDDGVLENFVKRPSGYVQRQSLPPAYVLNGSIYLATRELVRERHMLITKTTYAYIMPEERSFDIDTPWDMHLADLILSNRRAVSVDGANHKEDCTVPHGVR